MLHSDNHRHFPARLLLAGLILGASAAMASAAPHIRGEVTAIEGDVATVETTEGESVDVTLTPDFALMLFKDISIDAVQPDDYLSIPSITGPDGEKQALAINVFPAAMKGANEGVSDWDIAPESQMTNATVGELEAQGADYTVTVTYGEEEEIVSVPAGTPVTTFAPVEGRELAVGDNAVFFAEEQDGAYSAGMAGVSEDGSLPPI